MPQDNISPEERLLRLIRKDTKKSAKKQEASVSLLPIPRPLQIKKRVKLGVKRRFSFTLLNRLLLVILLFLGIYLLFNFLMATPNKIEESVLMFELEEEKDAKLELPQRTLAQEAQRPLSYFSQPVKAKNLFTAQAQTGADTPSVDVMAMVSKLRLQGIVAGANPQAIIEDAKTGQTYFLSPGERIGEIELKKVFPGKVILDYHGQEVELSL